MRRRDWGAAPFIRPAIGAFGIAVVLLLWSAARLVGAGTVPNDPAPHDALAVPRLALPARVAARDAPLDDDPFSPDRAAPDRRYALPGDAPAADAASVARPTLLGTAVAPGADGFATARLGDAPAKILHLGDRLGPYTLRAIARGRATFSGPDGEPFDVRAGVSPASK